MSPNLRKIITHALHCEGRISLQTSTIPDTIPGNEKQYPGANAQQHQELLTTGLNPGAARISRKYIFLNRSSSSFIARLRKGDDGIWKTVRVSMSDGVTERGAGSARIVPGAKPDELVRESGWAAG